MIFKWREDKTFYNLLSVPSIHMIATALEKLEFDVVGAARSGKEVVEQYMNLKPDIAFIDIALSV